MKRWVSILLLAAMGTAIIGPLAFAATASAPAAPKPAATKPATPDRSPAGPIAATISTVTGIAISPLLGTGAYGAYRWWSAKDEAARAQLPWFAQMKFWLPAILLVGACALKDVAGAAVPAQLKKPLDVMEVVENKVSGIVAAGAVVPITVGAGMKLLMGQDPTAAGPLLDASGLAMIQVGAFDGSAILGVLAMPFALAMFGVVWLASHAINVLILLSPWGAIDAALKATRTALLGLLTLTATIEPWLGACLSLVVILVAYLLAGWAFRLTVFGTLFSWDFFTLRSRRFTPAENDNAMFAGSNFRAVPVRTYGRLVQRTEGGLEFFYRPWPWLPVRHVPVPGAREELAVGRGLFFSEISNREDRTIFLLPPRYRSHEETLCRSYRFNAVKPAGLRKAWSELRALFGGRAVKT